MFLIFFSRENDFRFNSVRTIKIVKSLIFDETKKTTKDNFKKNY